VLLRIATERHVAFSGLPAASGSLVFAHPPGPRIRIAYVSADFYAHATMYLMAAMLEHHDRERFDITLVNIDRERDDPWAARARAAADHWLAAETMSDIALANELRRRCIDVVIDLKGHTRQARPGIFGERAAPVQVNYLGYPGTTGIPAMDYIIADRHLIDADNRAGFTEKVVQLPGSYQPNDADRPVGPVPTRASLGLPEDAVVYAAFNQISKLTPDVFAIWLRILAQVPGSVLWIWAKEPQARANLRATASAGGIDPDRLVFADTMPAPLHLARLTQADLFLDTLPYTAHTTASDALLRGVPVLTRTGLSFAARVATSLVHNVGLPELAVDDAVQYEELAVTLGLDAARRAALKAKLAANLLTAPLFDVVAYTRAFESALTTMVARSRAGLPPADFAV
jgi:protein O-GlcNAc transferase